MLVIGMQDGDLGEFAYNFNFVTSHYYKDVDRKELLHKAFSVVPTVVANYGDNVEYSTPCTADDFSKTAFIARHSSVGGAWRVNWIAIGRA